MMMTDELLEWIMKQIKLMLVELLLAKLSMHGVLNIGTETSQVAIRAYWAGTIIRIDIKLKND